LQILNYCGNQAAVLNIDISKYVKSGAPGAARKTSIYGRREQFGPVVDCLPGERRRENFKVINQLLNEARENNFLMPAKLSIRREQFAPGGYAIKFELYSKKLNKTFLFFDNLNANYSIE
nr:hypothetical protein [Pseudobdellovibrionaceae bacterium]